MDMKKIVAVGLFLIASASAYSGGKEYTFKICDKGKDKCDECKDIEKKVTFKVSKSLGSVMRTVLKKDGTSKSSTIDNCKIFDDETFECETYFAYSDFHFILSNGKWEQTSRHKIYDTYYCGTEIKSLLNLFK